MTDSPSDVQDAALVDDEEEEAEEEMSEFHMPATGPDREEMAAAYLPEKEDWPAKTILSFNDPARLAALENWGDLFPECEHHQPIYDAYVDTFLRARTSVGGESRMDFKEIIKAMFGAVGDDSRNSFAVNMLAGDMDDD